MRVWHNFFLFVTDFFFKFSLQIIYDVMHSKTSIVYLACQSAVRDVQSITSPRAFLLLSENLDKSNAEMDQCRTLLEKLQVVTGR